METRSEKLLQMLVEQPEDTFLLYALAMEERALLHHIEAEKWLVLVLEKDPEHIAAHFQLGQLLAETQRNEDAINWLEKGHALCLLKNEQKTAREIKALLDELLF
jgi:tetratricopeptide (TPR) repeat protein